MTTHDPDTGEIIEQAADGRYLTPAANSGADVIDHSQAARKAGIAGIGQRNRVACRCPVCGR